MINALISKFQDPRKGFDPVPSDYVKKYFEQAYNGQRFNQKTIDCLTQYIDVSKSKVLDLGAGPGQYTKYFVEQGAETHYHDISKGYLQLFKEKFPDLKFTASLDYLDHFQGQYDLIFNNVCFNYCMDDRKFVKKIAQGLIPGGIYFGVLGNENVFKNELSKNAFLIKMQFLLNDIFGIKIGHPFTGRKRIKRLFTKKYFEILALEDFEANTLVVVKKKEV